MKNKLSSFLVCIQQHAKKFQQSIVYRTSAKAVAILITIGAIYGGLQAITDFSSIISSDARSEQTSYDQLSLGISNAYINDLFGTPIADKEIDNGLTYCAHETKHTYLSTIYQDESLVAFFVFLKDGAAINMPYPLFPKSLGQFTYSEMSFPAQQVNIDCGNGNLGFSLYEELHGSGRWGYYHTYVIGECSLGEPVKGSRYLYDFFGAPDSGKYSVESASFWSNDDFHNAREKSYPNFAGVIGHNVDLEFPFMDFYLTLCEKQK